jgi:adenylylsulfate kinase
VASCVFLTGRAGAGKTTVGQAVADRLRAGDAPAVLVDDADVRTHLVGDDAADDGRAALIWLCRILVTGGATAIVAAAVPGREDRDRLREDVPAFVEVFLDAPAEVCAARAGRDDPDYGEPFAPELRVPTHGREPSASAAMVVSWLEEVGLVPRDPPQRR